MKCMAMDAFVSNKNESSSVIAIAGPVWKRGPLMRNKRLLRDPTLEVEAQELAGIEEDEEELEALPIPKLDEGERG